MDANTPLWRAHDLSQQLQDKLEVLPNVGRAFVHVDHETTHTPVESLFAFRLVRCVDFSVLFCFCDAIVVSDRNIARHYESRIVRKERGQGRGAPGLSYLYTHTRTTTQR